MHTSARTLTSSASLDPDEVHVHYRLFETLSDGEREEAAQTLSCLERDRAAGFAFDRDRLSFIVAHALLRQVLSRYEPISPAAWQFAADRFGKPSIANATAERIEFNLSHTHGLAAVAVSRRAAVGVDVESIDRRVTTLDIASRYFSAAECADLQSCPESECDSHFVEMWTLKEAYVKAVGMGLSLPMPTFTIRFGAQSSIIFEPQDPTRPSCRFALFAPTPRHRMAVAVLSPPSVVPLITAQASSGGTPATPIRASS